jgi:hypothetical protein
MLKQIIANTTVTAVIMGWVRHGLTTAGGSLVTFGYLQSSDIDTGVGAAMTLIGLVLSAVNKKLAA